MERSGSRIFRDLTGFWPSRIISSQMAIKPSLLALRKGNVIAFLFVNIHVYRLPRQSTIPVPVAADIVPPPAIVDRSLTVASPVRVGCVTLLGRQTSVLSPDAVAGHGRPWRFCEPADKKVTRPGAAAVRFLCWGV